jgi:epoxyqueuosine reductase
MLVSSLARQQLQSQALAIGFPLVGFVTAQNAPGFSRLQEWIARGYMGNMSYIPKRVEAYQHPDAVLEECKTLMMLAMPYTKHDRRVSADNLSTESMDEAVGRVGNYALGSMDYHDLIRDKLNQLCDALRTMFPDSRNRGVVDTAPLMERDFAQLAGLGWIGKNTLLLNRNLGSYFFLAAILTNIYLEPSHPFEADHCGSCTACLDACPTSAFAGPRVLDASRCISYLTIEHREAIAPELSQKMGDWIFGCDVCQIVCPWNRKASATIEEQLRPHDVANKRSIAYWLQLDEAEFRISFRHTPFWRTRLVGMQRNAMIAATNLRRVDLIPLIESFRNHSDSVLRITCERCLNQLTS